MFYGKFCHGPAIADVENNLACASIFGGAVADDGANRQASFTWKRRACVAQPQPNPISNLEQLGKRKKEGNVE
jgi:hypothetical protein